MIPEEGDRSTSENLFHIYCCEILKFYVSATFNKKRRFIVYDISFTFVLNSFRILFKSSFLTVTKNTQYCRNCSHSQTKIWTKTSLNWPIGNNNSQHTKKPMGGHLSNHTPLRIGVQKFSKNLEETQKF
jgi:hypothetical protein